MTANAVLRRLAVAGTLVAFALLFWATAIVTSSLPVIHVIAVDVHGLSPADSHPVRLAPLSSELLEDLLFGALPGGPIAPDGSLGAGPQPTATAVPLPPLLPTVSPGASLPPIPLPPTPTPSLLPTPSASAPASPASTPRNQPPVP